MNLRFASNEDMFSLYSFLYISAGNNSGNAINVTGRITDDFGLYRGTIRVVNDANGVVLVNQPYEIHGMLLYNFNINHTAASLSLYHSLFLSLSLSIHSQYYFCSTVLQSTVFIEHCSIPLALHTTTFFLPLIPPSYLQHSPTLLLVIPSVRPT